MDDITICSDDLIELCFSNRANRDFMNDLELAVCETILSEKERYLSNSNIKNLELSFFKSLKQIVDLRTNKDLVLYKELNVNWKKEYLELVYDLKNQIKKRTFSEWLTNYLNSLQARINEKKEIL